MTFMLTAYVAAMSLNTMIFFILFILKLSHILLLPLLKYTFTCWAPLNDWTDEFLFIIMVSIPPRVYISFYFQFCSRWFPLVLFCS